MKNTWLLFILFLVAAVCLSPSCKKKTEDSTDISLLPAATQTGANTFGCLVNGQAFIPQSNLFGTAPYQCNYIYLNGGYYLTVAGSHKTDSNITEIILGTTKLSISEGQTLKLEDYNVDGKAFGEYLIITNGVIFYQTTKIVTGELHITKFDQVNQIVSGTFFFDAATSSGDVVHVTDGRFDMQYTR